MDDISEELERTPFVMREPLRPVIASPLEVERYANQLAQGSGPIAIDAERASGFTYSQRAYLIQLRRLGAGTALIDPTEVPDLSPIAEVIHSSEWILHAATQDLECLREVGLHPTSLFDTELAGRLLGRERVGLAGLIESELGEYLEKGHGAANWSMRPLTPEMLKYAALDVELLLELRDSLVNSLKEANKWEIATQEFEALIRWQPRVATGEAWRRTSGIHGIRSPRGRAIARELWISRDDIARRRDIAPGRLIPDRAIVAAAKANPSSITELLGIRDFNGRGAKRFEKIWWAAIERALSLPESELPGSPPRNDTLPPPKAWLDKNPEAYARLEFVRKELKGISDAKSIPVENLILPELVRRICWDSPATDEATLRLRLEQSGVRPWQVDLALPILWASRDCEYVPPPDPPAE